MAENVGVYSDSLFEIDLKEIPMRCRPGTQAAGALALLSVLDQVRVPRDFHSGLHL
jgi:hypothetical protein